MDRKSTYVFVRLWEDFESWCLKFLTGFETVPIWRDHNSHILGVFVFLTLVATAAGGGSCFYYCVLMGVESRWLQSEFREQDVPDFGPVREVWVRWGRTYGFAQPAFELLMLQVCSRLRRQFVPVLCSFWNKRITIWTEPCSGLRVNKTQGTKQSSWVVNLPFVRY